MWFDYLNASITIKTNCVLNNITINNGHVSLLNCNVPKREVFIILKGTKREILSAMHVKELIQSNHSER